MKVSSTGILFLAAITSVKAMVQLQPTQPPPPQCVTKGFVGCECMFVGGCDPTGQPLADSVKNPRLDGFAPTGIDQSAYVKVSGKSPNLGWVCEGGLLAILYDCNGRIPLYAATVIEGNQAKQKVERTGAAFKSSDELGKAFQQDNEDYDKSSERIFCYKDQQTTALLAWDGKDACPSPAPKAPIHKGHMVAAGYAREDAARVKNTFVYTNCVPQFGIFNSVSWRIAENNDLVNKWGDNCHKQAKGNNVRIYVVVGAVPTTFTGNPKFFGQPGFSNFESDEYRVVVPDTMWTAACCVLDDNAVMDVTAFSRENLPNKDKVIKYTSPQKMVVTLFPPPRRAVNLFPANAKCMSG